MKRIFSLFIILCLLLTGCAVSPSAPQPPAGPEPQTQETEQKLRTLSSVGEDVIVSGSGWGETEVYRYDITNETYKVFDIGQYAGTLGQEAYVYQDKMLVVPVSLFWDSTSSYEGGEIDYIDNYSNGEVESRLLLVDKDGNVTEMMFDEGFMPIDAGARIIYKDEVFIETIQASTGDRVVAAFNLETGESRAVTALSSHKYLCDVYGEKVVVSSYLGSGETYQLLDLDTGEMTKLAQIDNEQHISQIGFFGGVIYCAPFEQLENGLNCYQICAISAATGEETRLCERLIPDIKVEGENYWEHFPWTPDVTFIGNKMYYETFVEHYDAPGDLETRTVIGRGLFSLNIDTGEVTRLMAHNSLSESVGTPIFENESIYITSNGGFDALSRPDWLHIVEKASLERGEPVVREFVLAE